MPRLPDAAALGERPTPNPSGAIAQYQPPRPDGAGQMLSAYSNDMVAASELIARTTERQDQVVAMDAANRLRQATLTLEQDPQNGYSAVRGNGVVGDQFTTSYLTKLRDAQTGIADTLTPSQRRVFDRHAEVVSLQFKSKLLQHQAKQTIAFNATTRENTISLGMADIAAHPFDDATFAQQSLLVGRTVVDAGKDLGLTGEALANWTQAGMQKMQAQALKYRTAGMLLKDPVKASEFFLKNELDFDPNDRITLGNQIKTAVDAQTTRIGGDKAAEAGIRAVAPPPPPPLPVNTGGDFVKPYKPERIAQIVQQVKQPSRFDADIQAAAQAFNVSPVELKLRLVSESGLDPKAVSRDPKGNPLAIGIAQFAPATAKAYGLDPNDPKASIFAAAKYMAKNGGTLGADMEPVDRAYYGGNRKAGGPNTNQYVENLRAVRQAMFGTKPVQVTEAILEASTGPVIQEAKAWAAQQRPGDQVYEDQVVANATRALSEQLQAVRGKNSAALSQIMSLFATDKPPRAVSDLPPPLQMAYAELPGTTQAALRTRMQQRDGTDVPRTEDTQRLMYTMMGAYTNNREAFANAKLDALIPLLPASDFDKLMSLQVQARNKADREADRQTNLLHAMTIAQKVALAPLKIFPPTKTSSQSQIDSYNEFSGRFQAQLEAFAAQNKRPPDDAEIAKIAGNLSYTVKVPGKFWGTNDVPAFRLDAAAEAKATVDLKPDDAQRLTSGFTARYGRQPLAAELQALRLAEMLHANDPEYLRRLDAAIRANRPPTRKASGVVQ